MLAPPDGLTDAGVAAALGRGWGLDVASVTYRAVGWGSQHWEAAGEDGTRWFVTADDLEQKQLAGTWLLIDWDTALIGPPERDLWSLEPGDGTILREYEQATGVAADPDLLVARIAGQGVPAQ
jgi:hypothetical protein